ncbi:hypothetical protein NEAUS06_1804 [Nematocida ausubeli]|nr:hypothetical protein NEAUS06_1804 [Nematocida ausubeli]
MQAGKMKRPTEKIVEKYIWRFMLILAYIYTPVNGILSLDQIEILQKNKIEYEGRHIIINPSGPLNLLRGYIIHKEGLIYNKRLFTPEISAKYQIVQASDVNAAFPVYSFNRGIENDAVASDGFSNDIKGGYLRTYHKILINMFPFHNESVPIESNEKDSFSRWTKSKKTKKHMYRLLAALLLMSEGIRIPIQIVGEEDDAHVVLKQKSRKEVVFCIPLPIKSEVQEPSDSRDFQKKTREIIKGFIEISSLRAKDAISEYDEPNTLEQFRTGLFLNSIKFLIQAYLFEFIGSVEEALLVNETVYDMILNQINETKPTEKRIISHYKRVLDRCFTTIDEYFYENNALTYINIIKEIPKAMIIKQALPFSNQQQIPNIKNIARNSINATLPQDTQQVVYSGNRNCILTILSVVCCLFYNPSVHMYEFKNKKCRTDHIEAFFNKNMKPFQSIGVTVYSEWCEHIENSIDRSKFFLYKRHAVGVGLFNMLYTLACCLNMGGRSKEKITNFANALNKSHEPMIWFYGDINEFVKSFFQKLTCNKNLSVSCKKLVRRKVVNKFDVFGEIVLEYKYDDRQETISIHLTTEDTYFNITDSRIISHDSREERLQSLMNTSQERDNFTSCLVSYCIYNIIKSIDQRKKDGLHDICNMPNTSDLDYEEISKILIMRKITDIEYKKDLVIWAIVQTSKSDGNISAETPGMRFISNIVASYYAHDVNSLKSILSCITLIKNHISVTPEINIREETYKKMKEQANPTIMKISILYAIERKAPELLIYYITNYLKANEKTPDVWPDVVLVISNKEVFDVLFKLNNVLYSTDMLNTIDSMDYKSAELRMYLSIAWFVYACETKKEFPTLIETLYSSISIKNVETKKYACCIISQDNFKSVHAFLDIQKKSLSKDNQEEREKGKKKIKDIIPIMHTHLYDMAF